MPKTWLEAVDYGDSKLFSKQKNKKYINGGNAR